MKMKPYLKKTGDFGMKPFPSLSRLGKLCRCTVWRLTRAFGEQPNYADKHHHCAMAAIQWVAAWGERNMAKGHLMGKKVNQGSLIIL